jgi:hypothetical protein
LSAKTESLIPVRFSRVNEAEGIPTGGADLYRKTFAGPEVSFPADVLEATTFFQFTESGVNSQPPAAVRHL